MFAAYWQHDAADGRGLGLWICREIVEAHGGRIWIEGGDHGTTVIFALPSDDAGAVRTRSDDMPAASD